ncbi:preprotein translocase subunit SecG [Gimesia panareensis]|uniref:Preprotein translocase subunit SecG n=1 Tax=Gimesia panareensis TaxID=2527978 RepID=A0A518FY10_9PLAN|nr:cytochrome C oxidase subunit IV family protein [Gimesia panareensis]QDV21242.1 preprotein translocase subunit SecG [Gimesia panareensis]
MSDHVESDAHAEDTQSCHVHIVPVKVLIGVFLALVFLTIVTVEAAKYDTGSVDVIVSMAIATAKASLVVFIFMHLWYDKPLNRIMFFFSICFAAFFLCMILLDSHAYDHYVKGFMQDKAPAVAPAAPPAAAPAAAKQAAPEGKEAGAKADEKSAPEAEAKKAPEAAAKKAPETEAKPAPEKSDAEKK